MSCRRQQVIGALQTAGSEQRKRDIQVIELAGPGVGDDEVKPSVAKTRGERGVGRDVKANACISPEVAASNIDHRPVEPVVPTTRKMAIAERMNCCPAGSKWNCTCRVIYHVGKTASHYHF